MPERFVLLRGTPAGHVFLARPHHPDDAFTWTEWRSGSRRFDDRAEADGVREAIVGRQGIAVAEMA